MMNGRKLKDRGVMMDKIIDIDDRVPARRRRRRIRTNIKFTVLITIFLLVLGSLYYFQSSYSKIQTIKITGTDILTIDEYEEMLPFSIGDSMWGFKVDAVEAKLMKNEWVKSVELKRNLLTTVEITIKEYPKVAYVSMEGNFYPMLENGYILKNLESLELIDAPVFLQFEDEKLRKKVVQELGKLKPEVLALISQINGAAVDEDPYSITLFMNDGYEVRAEISTFATKLNYYPSIVSQIEQQETFEKGVIDIEVGSYFKPFSGEYLNLTMTDEEAVEEDESSGGEQGE
jgi:cell division protein FtsQ